MAQLNSDKTRYDGGLLGMSVLRVKEVSGKGTTAGTN